jgi:hypothetical protein
MWSATTALDGDSPTFALVSTYVEPPAGIETGDPILTIDARMVHNAP